MFSKLSLSFVIVLNLLGSQSADSKAQQSPATMEDGWTTLTAGKSVYGIRYDPSGAITVNSNLVMSCIPDSPGSAAGLYVSRPSPLKKFALVVCSKFAGDQAYIIDAAHNRVASRDVVPKHWQIINWVSWSPDERFALIAADGEITMGDMAFINLSSGISQEIHFKNFTNTRGIDPTKTPYDRLQDFNPDNIRWTSPTRFHLNMDVRCNPYERGEGCYDKTISTHPVQVNLSPFRISYVAAAPMLRASTTKRNPAARSSTNNTIRRVDFLNFTYPTSICAKEFGFAPTVTVHDGDYQEGSDLDSTYFGIVGHKILFADVTAGGNEEALVHIACGHTGWNWDLELILLYKPDNTGGTTRIGEINRDQMVNDYHRYYPAGSLVSTTAVRPQSGSLLIDWAADGPRCCPKYIATFQYRWNGQQFVLTARPQKRSFKR